MQTAVRRLSSYSPASSSSSSEKVFIGLPSALLRTNSSSQGKPFAASIHSSSCKPQKGKRIPKEERRALVESFVNKYRAQNVGKFPSLTQVRKEVGGQHYIIRVLVQELEHNAKLASFNKETRVSRKVEDGGQISYAEISSAVVADENLKLSTMTKDESSVPLKSAIEADSSQTPPGDPVGCQTEISTIDSSQGTPNHKAVEHARDDTTLKTDMEDLQPIERNRSSNHGDSPRETNWWGSMRALADGIFSIWRKK
ncbi:uncharacterized protein LOC121983915 [Zingiber officinale]|uniref:uncharacterized protein LOC121983915 n=1 Tax=Zingiber officinale TaxID=94328 RepID=UPI001C4D61FA|nr:uncharacterized protein LOC121983915 [Zingiber officinale]